MNVSELCIRRPVMTVLLTVLLVLVGWVGYRGLPIAALPKMDLPVIVVQADLPGATPEVVASTLAAPLERQLTTIPGLESISSQSNQGRTTITAQFALGRNIDAAAQDVQESIAAVQKQLPKEMPAPPAFHKNNPAMAPIMFYALSSKTLSLPLLNEVAENTIVPNLSAVPGVSRVMILGAQRYAVRVRADQGALESRGLGFDDVRQALSSALSITPAGRIDGPGQSFPVEIGAQPRNAADLAVVPIGRKAGVQVVRVGDVARVLDAVEDAQSAAYSNGEQVILLSIQRQPDSNAVAVADSVRRQIVHLQPRIQKGVVLNELYDQTTTVREAARDVQMTLLLTIALVVLTVLLFLKRITATLVPAIALPMSIVGTFAVMWMADFSLNNITMLALTLAVGFVVDDAIVVVENTMRHVEEGMAPLQAAIAGAREVGFTILSITLSLVMVFVPIIFMPGVVGRLFHEFGVTISVAILWSGLVSLTLTPLLCATFLKAETPGRRENFVIAGFDVLFGAMTDFYRVTLDIALRFKGMVMLAMLATILATGALLAISPKGFFPTEDTGFIIAVTDARDDVSYPAVLTEHQHLADVLRKHPAVRSVTFVVGLNDINGSLTTGKLFVELKDKSQRAPILKVVQELRSLSLQAPGLLAYYQPVQSLQSGAKSSKAKYMVSLLGSDLYAVEQGATRMLANLQKYPELQDVSQDIEDTVPRIKFTPNLQRLADLGIAPDQVRQTLYLALAGARVDSIYTSTSSYSVILELLPEQRAFPEQLGRIHIKTASGKLVPLSVLGSIEETRGPSAVAHTGGLPSITLSFNTAPGVTLDKALGLVKKAEEDAHLDSSVSAQLGGDAANFAQGQSGQALLLVAALFAIYVILGILYESFIHPITILAGLPSAALGAVLALLIFGMQLDVISMIGILMLIGIVKKNAIMMVDFALERYREGVTDPHQAIRDACLTRFRPIMMTTFAAIVGALPIAAGLGAGAELRQPLGVAVVGGLLFSQLVTLYLTPVIFIYLDKLSRRKPVEQGTA